MPTEHRTRESHRIQSRRQVVRAGLISVSVGALILAGKFIAWLVTGSSALLADASESIVNVIAAAIATYSVAVAARPADADHPYGHGKAEFISAAVEGGLIVVAAIVIVVGAVGHIIEGPHLERLGFGIVLAGAMGLANLGLGLYLLRIGRGEGSEAIQADATHILARKTALASSELAQLLTGFVVAGFTSSDFFLTNLCAPSPRFVHPGPASFSVLTFTRLASKMSCRAYCHKVSRFVLKCNRVKSAESM